MSFFAPDAQKARHELIRGSYMPFRKQGLQAVARRPFVGENLMPMKVGGSHAVNRDFCFRCIAVWPAVFRHPLSLLLRQVAVPELPAAIFY